MKITDPKVIQSGEKAFLNAVKDHLDWNSIREVVKKKMAQCSLESKGGALVVHDNSVAFRIDVHCAMDVSIMFDRHGNLVSEEIPAVGTGQSDTARTSDEERGGNVHADNLTPPVSGVASSALSAEPSVEMDMDSEDEDDADVLELNDLLGDVAPEDDTYSPDRAEKSEGGDDGEEDLESLFFKENDNDADEVSDEDDAFWDDK